MSGLSLRLSVGIVVVEMLLGWAPTARADEGTGVPSADGVELGSLSRLAQLEAQNGNGGAEEEASPILAGYDKKEGFFLRDKDGLFYLNIGVQLQFRYTFFARDVQGDHVNSDGGPGDVDGDGDVDDEVGKADDSFFEIERARLVFQGHVLTKNLKYKYQTEGDTDSSGALRTLDAYLEYWAGDALGADDASVLGLGIGQFKPHFMRQEAMSTKKLQMVDRSLTDEFFNIDRNMGIWAEGDVGMMYYQFAVTNGFDSVNVAPAGIDQIPAFIAHIDLTPMGKIDRGEYSEGNVENVDLFSVGASFAYDANNKSSNAGGLDFKVYQIGLDTQFKLAPGFSLQAEYVMRWLDYENGNTAIPGGDGSAQFAHGFYVQGGFFLIDKTLEVTGLVSTVWANGPQSGSGFQAGPGLNWYISGNHRIKWQTDLTWVDISDNLPDSTEDLDGNPAGGSPAAPPSAVAGPASSFNSSAANIRAGEQGVLLRTQLQLSF